MPAVRTFVAGRQNGYAVLAPLLQALGGLWLVSWKIGRQDGLSPTIGLGLSFYLYFFSANLGPLNGFAMYALLACIFSSAGSTGA